MPGRVTVFHGSSQGAEAGVPGAAEYHDPLLHPRPVRAIAAYARLHSSRVTDD